VDDRIHAREEQLLAGYAMHSRDSRGRAHRDESDPWRSPYQRDRDRIVHSRAFRRLQYKTQVFTNEEGDHFRTRLTHTIEVSQLARSAAMRLRLNEDLVEAIALVHDVGHPPFGHRGEDLLKDLMGAHGGYEHNRQGLRIVEELESRYPEFPGLNLTFEVRESIIKHSAHYDRSLVPVRFHPEESPLLEAQLVDEIDSIVYDCHDIDDGLRSGIISLAGLQELTLWRGAWSEAVEASPREASEKLLIDRALRRLMGAMLSDLIEHSQSLIRSAGVDSVALVRSHPRQLIEVSPSLKTAKERLESWLFANLYRDWRINRVFHKARKMLADLFHFYCENPDSLPTAFSLRADGAGLHRAVADYISGMTDRYAIDEHRTLFQA
jgi:dGTPase